MFDLVVEVIRRGRRFLVTMHRDPDGDALGASLALACALREMGKEVVHYNPDPLPFNFRFLSGVNEITRTVPVGPFDATIACDTPRMDWLGEGVPKSSEKRGVLINLDHHKSSQEIGDLNVVDPDAASAGVLVYRLLKEMGHEISLNVAWAIYASILTDTGSFRYDSTDTECMRICAELIDAGVSPWQLSSNIYETQPASRLKLLSKVLSTLELAQGGRLAILTVTRRMLEETGGSLDMLDGFVNHARSVEGVEIALILVEQSENKYHASFRSRGNVELFSLGKRLNGRGTAHGASACLTGRLSEVKQRAAHAVGGLFEVADAAVA